MRHGLEVSFVPAMDQFDMVGRVYKGVPAPTNLIVPPHFFDGDILTIGEDKGVA